MSREPETVAEIKQLTALPSVLIRLCFAITVPVLLTLFSVRLAMTPFYLRLEYARPGFPEDVYGFTQAERLEYARHTVIYLFNDANISFLGELTFPDGGHLYSARELRHMEDVKVVTRNVFRSLIVWCSVTALLGVGVWRNKANRWVLYQGLLIGCVLTLIIIAIIVLLAVVAWDHFFTGFHQVFFEGGTWRFYYSDTLIRLFPQQFWFDAALAIGGLTVLSASVLAIILWASLRTIYHKEQIENMSSALQSSDPI